MTPANPALVRRDGATFHPVADGADRADGRRSAARRSTVPVEVDAGRGRAGRSASSST